MFKNVYERRTPKWVDQLDTDGTQDVVEFNLRTLVR